jgi:hypothetical protein
MMSGPRSLCRRDSVADGGLRRSGFGERGNTKSRSDIASTPLLTLPE